MIAHRPFAALGGRDLGWLDAKFHFAAAGLGDPAHTALRGLHVWNDDVIAAGAGFPLHPHRDVEIITYVRQGAIVHEDDLGNRERIEAGQVQAMSAGTGIRHAERSAGEVAAHVYQLWLRPRMRGVAPSWRTRAFPQHEQGWRVLASGYEEEGALAINADARLVAATMSPGEALAYPLVPGAQAYLVAVDGALCLNGVELGARDGAVIVDESMLALVARQATRVVMVELPAVREALIDSWRRSWP